MATLRLDCGWDRAQTHASLRRHLLEECHETLDALDRVGSPLGHSDVAAAFDDLREELGDVLFQVVFHAHLAAEESRFDLTDVIDGVRSKLVERHPMIFADASGADGAVTGFGDEARRAEHGAAWERAKVAEKGRSSVMDGIPSTLPALAYAAKVIAKAHAVAPAAVPPLPDVAVSSTDEIALGQDLLAVVQAASSAGLDAEAALRSAARALEDSVRDVERHRSDGDGDGERRRSDGDGDGD